MGKPLCGSFFIKLQAWDLKEFPVKVFSCKFCEIFQSILQKTFGWLHLYLFIDWFNLFIVDNKNAIKNTLKSANVALNTWLI